MDNTAYLSNRDGFIIFSFRGRDIRFKGPYSLLHFEKIIQWDKGYLVVGAKYAHSDKAIEDYIDLVPILQDLYMDAEQFLKPIERVEVRYA